MRYQRQIQLSEIGSDGQALLSASSVCIIGCGGLGVPASLYLAAAGIGRIHLVDFDKIELSNLHRQPVYLESQLGLYKAECLTKHLKSINSEIKVECSIERFTQNNALELIKDADIVVDCSDNLETRYLINDACILGNKPFVSASIHKHEGQLSVFNFKGGPSYRCLYQEAAKTFETKSCEETGVLGTLASIMGSMQANEVLKMCLNIDEVFSGKVFLTSILTYQTSTYTLIRNQSQIQVALDREKEFHGLVESQDTFEIEWRNIGSKNLDHFRFIDIREAQETPKIQSNWITSIPLSSGKIENLMKETAKTTVVVCQKGIRSLSVAKYLSKKWSTPVYSLKDGIIPFTKAHLFKDKDLKVHEEN